MSGKGKIPWNKGLTKETDERVEEISSKIKEAVKEKHLNGEVSYWRKGLTKETNEKVKSSGEKQKETKRRLREEGKLVAWNKGLTKDTDSRMAKQAEACKGTRNPWNKDLSKETDERVKLSAVKSGETIKKHFETTDAWNKDKTRAEDPRISSHESWNKDLTKEDPRVLKNVTNAGITKKERYAADIIRIWNKDLTKDSDPRMLVNALNSARTRRKLMAEGKWNFNNSYYKSGYREDLGHFVRSSWEANFARLMIFLGVEYKYECKMFVFSNETTYRPDFYLPHLNSWVEVKGRWYLEAVIKVAAFYEEYPEEVLDIVDQNQYTKLRKKFAKYIPNWEY